MPPLLSTDAPSKNYSPFPKGVGKKKRKRRGKQQRDSWGGREGGINGLSRGPRWGREKEEKSLSGNFPVASAADEGSR